MMKMSNLIGSACGLTALIAVTTHTALAGQDVLSAYPKNVEGLQRYVITLPKQAKEENFQVELIIGKKMLVDCNRTSLVGKLTTKTIDGWGYDYYQVAVNPGIISTKMACINQPQQQKFVTLSLPDDQRFVTYNSRMPIVIFAPKDLEVNYRLWQANTKTFPAKKG